jgi:hypothetical protein
VEAGHRKVPNTSPVHASGAVFRLTAEFVDGHTARGPNEAQLARYGPRGARLPVCRCSTKRPPVTSRCSWAMGCPTRPGVGTDVPPVLSEPRPCFGSTMLAATSRAHSRRSSASSAAACEASAPRRSSTKCYFVAVTAPMRPAQLQAGDGGRRRTAADRAAGLVAEISFPRARVSTQPVNAMHRYLNAVQGTFRERCPPSRARGRYASTTIRTCRRPRSPRERSTRRARRRSRGGTGWRPSP